MATKQTTSIQEKKLLSHPTRAAIISMYAHTRRLSPVKAASILDVTLGAISYHFRALHEAGVLKLDSTQPVRGTVEHFYSLAPSYKRMIPAASLIETTLGDHVLAPVQLAGRFDSAGVKRLKELIDDFERHVRVIPSSDGGQLIDIAVIATKAN